MYEDIALFLGFAFVIFLSNSVILCVTSKILKLKKRDYATSVKTVVIYNIASFALFAFVDSIQKTGSIPADCVMMVLLVLVLILGALYFCLIKKFYETGWKNALSASLFVLVVNVIMGVIIYWLLGGFNVGTPPYFVYVDWYKMEPLTPSVFYRANGAFAIELVNAHGSTVNVTSVSLTNGTPKHPVFRIVNESVNCGTIEVNNESFTDGKGNVRVDPGQIIQINAACPEKNIDEGYNALLSINYSAGMNGIVSTYNEMGLIKGIVEA